MIREKKKDEIIFTLFTRYYIIHIKVVVVMIKGG